MANSNKTSGKMSAPESKDAMNRFKEEVASEIGVNLKQGYNGDITAKEAGSIGGEMVRKMVNNQKQQMSGNSNQ
ncbi:Small, acid-soluble spore protein, alpha/beta type [Lachnospiraceae bacterium XBB1006]|nr:Small, acid-soluble spore protein, alpha/beta type [Lachnospiraceae bacterium XBB1006]